MHEETGLLVPLAQDDQAPFEPLNPDAYALDLAESINRLLRDSTQRESFAQAGRARAHEVFSWSSIARQTLELYKGLL